MTTEKALNVIYEGLLGEQSILVKLRNKEGLDEEKYDLILEAIEVLKEAYKDQEYIPKKLALAFLDVSNYFIFGDEWYPEEEQEKIEDAGHQLVQAVDELLS
ncbi:hypothetical protein FAM09_17480 [Niastella caeni]|uniref:Uncharacterized protein n=1 Tax=Niastella caeni TaxID=2569763 RepID=A0A4S8HUX3_9BACT|nr:hypothetical protein [Niastella caeni]THU38459.1 hypothetical protein FAM09_17480 [Niastella caeni]